MSGFEIMEGASKASLGRREQKKHRLKPGLLYTEKNSGTNKMFACSLSDAERYKVKRRN